APDTLGSDVYAHNLNGPVWDLSVVMSKILALGLSFSQVLEGVTAAPRRALGLPEARLEPGAEAAFTIFSLDGTDLSLPDAEGEAMRLEKRFTPRAILWRGELADAASRLPAGSGGGAGGARP
ncbi:MAG: amidohydrolase/deacetylase family metallohydrolase, partial [Planctomycetota bacterium]|nr:amidohydrolase/deacetylase family metallohydrolase [Planctomycetota bacterium]